MVRTWCGQTRDLQGWQPLWESSHLEHVWCFHHAELALVNGRPRCSSVSGPRATSGCRHAVTASPCWALSTPVVDRALK
eukprot:scaffold36_cov397-Prasinococcus_capsulatus_cf.AAC.6